MNYTINLYDPSSGQLTNITRRIRNVQISDDAVSCELPCNADEAAMYVDDMRYRWLVVARSDGVVTRYRLNTPSLIKNGVRFEAISLIATLDDGEYSALWSDVGVGNWISVTTDMHSSCNDKLYVSDANNRLFIGLKKNAVYPMTGASGCAWAWQTPVVSSKKAQFLQLKIETNLANAFVLEIYKCNYGFNTLTPLYSFTCSGVADSRAIAMNYVAGDILFVRIRNGSAANYTNTAEDGMNYLKLTNLRVATTTTNMVNTTVAATISTGTQTVTPASMANVFAGQQLVINSGATDSEMVTVTAITATQFTATFAKAHAANSTVRGIVVYDDEIVRDVLNTTLTLNPNGGLLSGTGYIQQNKIDRENARWSSARATAILDELAKPVRYKFGIRDNRLYYESSNAFGRIWRVRVSDLEISRPLDELVNSVRSEYQNAANEAQFTTYQTDAVSVALNGVTRQQTINTQTTSATLATTLAQTSLNDSKNRPVRSAIKIKRITDQYGASYPADSIAIGDTLIIVGLPPLLAANDKLRTLTVGDVAIETNTGLPLVTPEQPLKLLDVLLAQLAL